MKMDKWTRNGYLVVKLWILENGTHGMVSGHLISTSLPQVDGWSTGPRILGCHRTNLQNGDVGEFLRNTLP